MSIQQHILKSTLLNLARFATLLVTSLVVSATLARSLGTDRMGAYSYANWIAVLLATIATLGLPTVLEKYGAEFISRGEVTIASRVSRRLLTTQLLVAFIVSGLAAPFLFLVLKQSHTVLILALAVQTALNASVIGAMAGSQQFSRIAAVTVVTAALQVIVIGIGALLHVGVTGMLVANLTAGLCGTCLGWRLLRQVLHTPKEPTIIDKQVGTRVRRFALAASYITLIDFIVFDKSELLFLKHFSTLSDVGFYSIAFALSMKVAGVGGAFTGLLVPVSSQLFADGGDEQLLKLYSRSIKYLQMITMPLCGFGIILAGPLIRVIYGPSYLPLVTPLRVLLSSTSIVTLGSVCYAVLYAKERHALLAKLVTAFAILNVALDWVLIPRLAATGAAIGNACTQVIAIAVLLYCAARIVGTRVPLISFTKILFCTGVAMLPLHLTVSNNSGVIGIVFAAFLGGTTYFILLVSSGQVGRPELDMLTTLFSVQKAPGQIAANEQCSRSGADNFRRTSVVGHKT